MRQTLANSADRVELRAFVTLAGTMNSAAGSATSRTQFRYALLDRDDVGVALPMRRRRVA